ncbi:MAG: hypothetical protein KF812_11940 [Fimbriimonadaceae bacterium]|nr:hypothetical protein [Fimbriimonadaceae bacterium]
MALGSIGAMASAASKTEITVYGAGFGLVRERRSLYLRVGEQTIALEDVSDKIDANTVSAQSVNRPGTFSIVEQTFRHEALTPESMIQRSIGRKAVLTRILNEKSRERTSGLILNAPIGVESASESGPTWIGLVFKSDDGRFILSPTGQLELSQVPKNFYTKPTLLWEVSSTVSGENEIELSYVTHGLKWRAGYALWLEPEGNKGELKGWITIENETGLHYSDAMIRVTDGRGSTKTSSADETSQELGLPDLNVPQTHSYTVQRPATLRAGETKQLLYVESLSMEVSRRLVLDPLAKFRGLKPGDKPVGVGNLHPLVLYAFQNDAANDLGIPLPAGPIQVFRRGNGHVAQVLGEDFIEHTPNHDTITLIAGNAEHVTISRDRIEYEEREDGASAHERFEIAFVNDGDEEENIHLVERNWSSGKVSDETHPYTAIDSHAILFVVSVPAKSRVTIAYSLDSRLD